MRSNLLVGIGRVDEGVADASKAVELDQNFWIGWLALGVLLAIRGHAGPVGLALYALARGDNEAAAEWAVKAVEQRFPASIPRIVRQFEPLLRPTAAWPRVLQAAKLA